MHAPSFKVGNEVVVLFVGVVFVKVLFVVVFLGFGALVVVDLSIDKETD